MSRRPPLRPTAAAAIVLHGEGDAARVLVVRRRGGPFDGAWNLITGWIEGDETAVDAAVREVREETGLDVTAVWTAERVDAFYDPLADGIQIVPVFVVRVDTEAVVLDDAHDAHAWLTPEEAAERLAFAVHRDAAAALRRTLLGGAPDPWRRLR